MRTLNIHHFEAHKCQEVSSEGSPSLLTHSSAESILILDEEEGSDTDLSQIDGMVGELASTKSNVRLRKTNFSLNQAKQTKRIKDAE